MFRCFLSVFVVVAVVHGLRSNFCFDCSNCISFISGDQVGGCKCSDLSIGTPSGPLRGVG